MDVALVNVTPFVMALAVPVIGMRLRRTLLAWGVAAILAFLFVFLLRDVGRVAAGEAITASIQWIPALGLSLSLYLDSLSLLFALLVTGIGALIALFAGYYFDEVADLTRFYRFLLLFMGGMLALVLSGNLLTLFIGWEITSVTSFFLISFYGDDPKARQGALQALIITAGGGLALLAGLILLGTAAGTFEFAEILTKGGVVRDHPLFIAIAVLVFIGCFSKSAQFPLHFWLPDAMTAPTPASAYLHSATMVKAGVYLLFRLYPVLGDNALWGSVLLTVGLITMLIGAVLALRQTDLKGALAYSTISQLGALVALIGLPDGEGLLPALIGILAHALYKGAMFLVAGTVDHAAGTRDIRRLGGLRVHMMPLAVIAGVAGVSMAGLPPLLGFVAKEGLLEAVVENNSILAIAIVTVSALFTVTMAAILVWDVFFRPAPADAHVHPHAPNWGMYISPGVLAALSLLTGLLLTPLVEPLVKPYLHGKYLSLWHGVNTPLILSVVAIVGGLVAFGLRRTWQGWVWPALPRGRDVYDRTVRRVEAFADLLLTSQHGKLRYYLAAIIVTVVLLMTTSGLTGLQYNIRPIAFASASDFLKVVLLVLTIGATFVSIIFRRHLLAALALGVAGYSVGGLFLLEPAPDVALVQFLVETIGTVLVIIMLGKISAPERQQVIEAVWKGRNRGWLRDALIATAVGVGVGLFSLAAVLDRPTRSAITTWHIENSEKQVGATDIVAAIVTDFRGMDTVIEITVFGMAALGVLTLLSTPEPGRTVQFTAGRVLQRLRARGEVSREPTAAEKELQDPKIQREIAALLAERKPSIMSTPLTRVVATLLLPFTLLIAISHIAYGAGAPGDGFTAGVVSGLGIAVWYVVFGYDEAERRLRWLRPIRLIGAGIGLAILNAAVPLLFGAPFLATTQFKSLWLPADLHLTSTTFFEIGIFLTVMGSTALMLETIAHPQEVEML
jgi:multicomponent K+:H+ antiporter subunit A